MRHCCDNDDVGSERGTGNTRGGLVCRGTVVTNDPGRTGRLARLSAAIPSAKSPSITERVGWRRSSLPSFLFFLSSPFCAFNLSLACLCLTHLSHVCCLQPSISTSHPYPFSLPPPPPLPHHSVSLVFQLQPAARACAHCVVDFALACDGSVA